MGDPGLGPLLPAGRVERVAEQDERGVGRIRFRGGEAGDAAAERVAADRHVRGRRHHEMEGGQRILGLALGQIDGRGGHAACSQPADEGGHAGRRPAGAVSEIAAKAHRDSVAAVGRSGASGAIVAA